MARGHQNITATCILIAMMLISTSALAADVQSINEYDIKIAVENRLELRLATVLSALAGTDKIKVIINAYVETDEKALTRRRQQTEIELQRLRRPKVVLPGVPVKQEIGKQSEKKHTAILPSIINRLLVTVLIDTSVPENLFDIMRDVTINSIGYNPDRGDVINFKHIEFKRRQYDWSRLLNPPDLYWVIIITLGGFFILAMTFFIMNPFKNLTHALRNSKWGALQKADETEGASKETTAELPFGDELLEAETLISDSSMPFSFVKERHIPEVAFLLKDRASFETAIIMNYLPSETAIKLLENFPEERQAKIVLYLSKEEEVDPEKVQALEATLRERLDYIIGGDDKLASILDYTDETFREMIFEMIEKQNSETAVRLRQKVRSFESILRDMSEGSIQTLFHRTEPTTFARLLKTLPSDIQDKALVSLSEGAAERIREEMDLSRPFTGDRLKREKYAMITTIRRMSRAGLIEETF